VAERSQIRKPAPEKRTDRTEEAPADQRTADVEEAPAGADGAKVKAELDDLLDEIDEVLEANAEEFVKSYIQKGGE